LGRAGVICNKQIEIALQKAERPLPRNVSLAHYGAITGMNDLESVSTLILIGRSEPSPAAVEQQGRLLYGREVIEVARYHPERKGYYPRRKRGLAIRDSAELAIVDCTFHPDPAAESLRWAACEGELMQALHRARPINRTAANPLRIVLATNVPLPLEVDLVSSWDALQPLIAERMLAVHGAALFARPTWPWHSPTFFRVPRQRRRRCSENGEGRDHFLIEDSY
jgi:putative DNA primase/helicase